VSITYCEWLFVALRIQNTMRMRRIVPGCWYVLSPIRKATSSEACQRRAWFGQHRGERCQQVFFFSKARRRRKFTPFWQKH